MQGRITSRCATSIRTTHYLAEGRGHALLRGAHVGERFRRVRRHLVEFRDQIVGYRR